MPRSLSDYVLSSGSGLQVAYGDAQEWTNPSRFLPSGHPSWKAEAPACGWERCCSAAASWPLMPANCCSERSAACSRCCPVCHSVAFK